MRQLIDTEFRDLTSYPPQASGDRGAIVIDHFTGPANQLIVCTQDEFLEKFPAPQGVALTPSYVNAYKAFEHKLAKIEVVRLAGDSKYFCLVGKLSEGTLTVTAERQKTPELKEADAFCIAMKYPGNLPESYNKNKKYQISIKLDATKTEVKGVPDLTVALESYEETDEKVKTNVTVVESVTGGIQEGVQIDGEDYDISTLLYNSKYFQGLFNYEAGFTKDATSVTDYAQESVAAQAPKDLCEAYNDYFRSIESSAATILIDPGTTSAEEANILIGLAAYRQNCVAIVGYPESSPLTDTAVDEYKQTLTLDMFSAFYALREKVTIGGRKYASNAMGSVAGDFAATAKEAGVNQLPSGKSYGSTSMVLTSSFTFDQVLAMNNKGINSCYQSVDGPRLFGLRSLYKRESSYFSKFNVSRVCARILQYAFGVAIDAIHTGNTDSRKQLAQTNLQADVERLISDGALRVGSRVQCDANNNKDVDTKGGEILIIDYTCYFVKLIERVKIRITATDGSVSASISM